MVMESLVGMFFTRVTNAYDRCPRATIPRPRIAHRDGGSCQSSSNGSGLADHRSS